LSRRLEHSCDAQRKQSNRQGPDPPTRRVVNYIHELLPDVLEGRIEPGLVFDRTTNLDGVPDGYRAMKDREAIKVMIKF